MNLKRRLMDLIKLLKRAHMDIKRALYAWTWSHRELKRRLMDLKRSHMDRNRPLIDLKIPYMDLK